MNSNAPPKKPGPTQGTNHALIAERTKYAALLKMSGISYESILQTINEMDATKGWGKIQARQLRRNIAYYFSHHLETLHQDEIEELMGMRAVHLASMQDTIEKMAIHIRVKKDWKPFEKVRALEAYFNMLLKYAKTAGTHQGKRGL